MNERTTKQMTRERLRWGQIPLQAFETVLVALLLLLPRRWCAGWVRRQIAQRIYGCAESDVFLYKSGRAALRGLMEALKAASPDRCVAYVPDYVCNVVGEACRAAGFETIDYPTDGQCRPQWKELEERVRQDVAPVVVLCSLFGSIPAQALEAEALVRANPKVFVVADECQNLVPDSPVKPQSNRAVVFSFNDKTCPGLMGGGVVCSRDHGLAPVFSRGTGSRRILCSLALFRQGLLRMGREAVHQVRLVWGRPSGYRMPDTLEFSTCLRPHYDLVAEPIYKISLARAWVSLLFLESYRRIRVENAMALQSGLQGLQVGFDEVSVRSDPPFLPVFPAEAPLPQIAPAPVKPAYGISPIQSAASRNWIALKTNIPFVRYETEAETVVQLTSRHAITDNRILHCMARTADAYGYKSMVMGPARENDAFGRVQLQACPVLRDERRPAHLWLLARLFIGALKSGALSFQIHDPDLLPVGLLLKLFRRSVIYDVHDDYEASFRDRFRTRKWMGCWFPSFWWGFERTAARIFNGIVVADRHLAQKFERCHPVILGNYPRLDFTSVAQAEDEETFNLIYVGGVSRERGVEKMLEALKLLPMPHLRLHVIGSGHDSDLIDQLKAEPRIILHGRVPWIDLHQYYTKAHLGLALYQPLAGFVTVDHSVKIVEYMAAGLPVLCSDFPGLKAFVEDTGCGQVVQPDDPATIADKIRHLVEDPALCRKLGANGRRLFESGYHWEKQEHRLVDLYERVFKA